MSGEDVTLRLQLIDEFSKTTAKYLAEMRKTAGGSAAASKEMTSSFGAVSQKISDLDRIGVPGLGRLAGAFDTIGTAQSSSLGRFGLYAAGAGAAALAVGAIGKAMVDAASEGEQAEVRLTSALKATGRYTEAAVEGVKEWSEELLKAKGTSDELAMSLVGQGATMGLTIEQSKRFISAAADMEDIVGSTAGAFDMLARASTGDERALLSLGKQFGIAKTEGLSFEEMLTKIEEKTSGAAAAKVDTYTGQWKLFADLVGNELESAGTGLLSLLTVIPEYLNKGIIALGAGKNSTREDIKELRASLALFRRDVEKAPVAVESLSTSMTRAMSNAKIVSAVWKDDIKGLEQNFKTASDAIKKRTEELQSWVKQASESSAARVAGGAGIATAGASGAERQASEEARVQQLLVDSYFETGEKKVALLNEYAAAYESAKAAEVAADRAAMEELARNDADQYERDYSNLKAAIDAKIVLYQDEQRRIAEAIGEETDSVTSAKASDLEAAGNKAADIKAQIAELELQIGSVTMDMEKLDAILKDEKALKINATQAQMDMALLQNELSSVDEQVKAARDLYLNADPAITGARAVQSAIENIPQSKTVDVILRVVTQGGGETSAATSREIQSKIAADIARGSSPIPGALARR